MTPINWKECVALYESFSVRSRFEWPPQHTGGFNCYSEVTISELWGGIAWMWTWPGDWLLRTGQINRFFELGSNITGHWFSTLLGWVIFFYLCWHLFIGFMVFILGAERK